MFTLVLTTVFALLPTCNGAAVRALPATACPLPARPAARWIGFRLDVLVALLMTAAPLLMMAVHDRVSLPVVPCSALPADLAASPASKKTRLPACLDVPCSSVHW